MKFALMVCGILLACVLAQGENVEQQCGSHPDLLRSSSGELKWIGYKELEKLATGTADPEPVALPGVRDYKGYVSAKIMVGKTGDVVCIWGAAGHPVMIPGAIRAIHKWKFKPMVVRNRKFEFVGIIRVPVRSANSAS